MSSETLGNATLEVTGISRHGLWLLVHDQEYFLPFKHFPWFEQATIKEVIDVRLESGDHLHWPALDVDLTLEMLAHPERYPLVTKG